jgi:hypothetical protein
MLHICKLSVGVRDLAQLRARQAGSAPPFHQTRNFPRRAAEVLDGGSLYWVIGGIMSVRQPIIDIQPDTWDDGAPCARLTFAREYIPVAGRKIRPFQGWRYLQAADAPPDLTAVNADESALPEHLRHALRALCLL